MSFPGSEVPIAESSEADVSPPAPNWIPISGLAIRLCECTVSMRRSQSEDGKERKPEESSITSNLFCISMDIVDWERVGERGEGGGPEIFAFEEVFFKDRFCVRVGEEVFCPSALF